MKNIEEFKNSIEKDEKALTYLELKQKYLGKEGVLTKALKEILSVEKDKRAFYGKEINLLKNELENIINKKKNEEKSKYSTGEKIDPTAPFDINSNSNEFDNILAQEGSKHPLTKEIEKLLDIFTSMGFDVLESRQIDDDYHMFQSLNFPKGHPARDMYDTFRTEDGLVLPAHTSTMQNRALKKFGPPPIAVV